MSRGLHRQSTTILHPNIQPIRQLKPFRVLGLHGFNNKRGGAENLDLIYPHFEWADVTELDRDWDGLLEARWELKKEAERTKREVHKHKGKQSVILVGHSHGCNIIRETMTFESMQEEVHACILFNPAVRPDASFGGVPTLCFFSPSDPAVKASLALRFLPWNWIWKHPWGDAGAKGLLPLGDDLRVNVNEETLTGQMQVHSTIFTRESWRHLCNEEIKQFLLTHVKSGVLLHQISASPSPIPR